LFNNKIVQLFQTAFLAVGLAADACAVSLTSGLTIKYITPNKAIKIALFFGVFQAIMPLMGWLSGLILQDYLVAIDHWIAFILLGTIGSKMVYDSWQIEESEKFNPLDISTLLILAIATSVDALAAGFGLSMIKDTILQTAGLIGIITFIGSFLAVYLGHFCGDLFKNKIGVVGGLILIAIGTKILIEHLIY
jgi:putative Mn2+ efflux pump MntP